jgi:hypothetical protein
LELRWLEEEQAMGGYSDSPGARHGRSECQRTTTEGCPT